MEHSPNRRPNGQAEPTDARLSDAEINNRLNADAASALANIMHNGKLVGREFYCGDVHDTAAKRGSDGSFKFHVDKLIGRDFGPSSDVKGYKGVFSVYVANHRGDRRAARQTALSFLGLPEDSRPKPRLGRKLYSKSSDDTWTQVFPAPAIAPDFKSLIWSGYQLAGSWTYKAPDGKTLFHVIRMDQQVIDPETGEITINKVTPVVSYGYFSDGLRHWKTKGAGLNILYGLDELTLRRSAPVLVVEGEKAATAARLLFPDWVVVCWKGGCSNVVNIDFTPLRGRLVYLLADADKEGVAAMVTAQKRIASAGAVRTMLAEPPADCWKLKDGWDLADELPTGWTIERIRDHIVTSTPWSDDRLPAYYPAPAMSARDTRRMQAKLIGQYIPDEARMVTACIEAKKRADEEKAQSGELTTAQKSMITIRHKRAVAAEMGMDRLRNGRRVLITGSQGSGKSRDALKAIAALNIPWLRIVFTLPTVEKCWEAMEEYNGYRRRNSLPAYVVRGRAAHVDRPVDGVRLTDDRMCVRHATINRVASMQMSPRRTICPECPFRFNCKMLQQEEDLDSFDGGVFFMAREYIFITMQIKDFHMLIGDEALTSVAASDPVYVDPDMIRAVGNWSTTGVEAAVDAMAVLEKVHAVVTKHSGAVLAGARAEGLAVDELRRTAAYLDHVREAALEDKVDGTMTDEAIDTVLDQINSMEFGGVARLCRQLVLEMDQPRSQANTICLRHPKDKKTNVPLDRIAVFHLKRPRIKGALPVLLLDGTGNISLNRKVFGDQVEHHHLPIERSATIISTTARGFSRQSITGTDRDGEPMSAQILAEAAKLRGEIVNFAVSLKQSVFVCSSKRAEEAMASDFALARSMGSDISTAHFADVRGKNKWQNYPVALLIGREEISPMALEDMTRPFLASDPEPLVPSVDDEGRTAYVKQPRGRRMRDGTVEQVDVWVHPDPRCEEMHEQIREAELLQALDRVRAIYNRRLVYLLNDLCLDVTYDANIRWKDLKGGGARFDVAFERTDQTVFLDAPGEWSRCFPDLWRDRNTAKDAFKSYCKGGGRFPKVRREIPLGNPPPLCITYQRPGQGQQPCCAWVFSDPAKARSVLEKVVGPVLDNFTVDWTATISLQALPAAPDPLRGDEVEADAQEAEQPIMVLSAAAAVADFIRTGDAPVKAPVDTNRILLALKLQRVAAELAARPQAEPGEYEPDFQSSPAVYDEWSPEDGCDESPLGDPDVPGHINAAAEHGIVTHGRCWTGRD